MKTYWQKIKNIVGPALKKDFDQIGQKKTREAIEGFIVANSSKQTKLLDAGCNTGVEAVRLYERNFLGKYYGVDSNHKALRLAKKNLKEIKNARFSVQDVSKLNFKNNFFEFVLTKDVIEHYQYYVKILSELSRVCKKYLILSMFIKPSFFLGDRIRFHSDGYYLNRYNRPKLMRFLTKHGFKKVKKVYEDWQDIVFVFEKVL